MLPSTSNGSRCIYCAFRTQQLTLQARRVRNPVRQFHATATAHVRIRYDNRPPLQHNSGRAQDDVHSSSGSGFFGRTDKSSVIRKFKKGEEGDARKDRGRQEKANFETALKNRLNAAKDELKDAPLLDQLRKEKEAAGGKADSFPQIWKSFTSKLSLTDTSKRSIPYIDTPPPNPTLRDLRSAFQTRGSHGLDDRIKYAFYAHLTGTRFTPSDIRNQQTLADLRYPSEWFPATRQIHRTIHLHVGPTNSGKTYHALQRLEKAETGVYGGPLRLLAHEVYMRMNAKGRACSLITGEERRMARREQGDSGSMFACTVEMMPLNKSLDVAVIDEIQMIGSAERGWAWTQALLGVKAKEVHLCGEERTVPLIRELCASVGEKLEIHHYERLSPLQVADKSLEGRLQDLRKGDCIVSFSVMGIHALRRQIERATGKKVATVYGSLPPETRAQQARLFNDPDNEYDYLVASDAVGMGLNLAIKRIIFEHSSKFDGVQRRPLSVADIKQIAGRAGRYRVAGFSNTAATTTQTGESNLATQPLAAAKGEDTSLTPPPPSHPDNETLGLVTTLEPFDYPLIRAAMSSEPDPIRSAGIFPPSPVLERFDSYFPPSTPFSYILTRLHELSQMHPRFHLCGLRDQVWVADLIEGVPGLTISDRNVICSSPASKTDLELWKDLMPAYARRIAEQSDGSIDGIAELPLEVLDAEVSASREYLRALERLHKGVVTYLWLSYRFAGIFSTRGLAFYVKGLVEEKIEAVLGKFSFEEAARRKLVVKREKEMARPLEGLGAVDGEEEGAVRDFVKEDEAAEGGGEQGQQQTDLTMGGDRFGGEEDMVLEDPDDAEVVAEPEESVSSFAQWRRQETRGESQGSRELDGEVDTMLSAGEEEGHAIAASRPEEPSSVADAMSGQQASLDGMSPEQDLISAGELESHAAASRKELLEERPTNQDEMSAGQSPDAMSPVQDPSNLEQPITPETEGDIPHGELETQQVPPEAEAVAEPGRGEGSMGGFAQWRLRETRGESQGSRELDGDIDTLLSDAISAREEEGEAAATRNELSEERLEMSEDASAEHGIIPKQDPSDLEQPSTPETDKEIPPPETQHAPSKPVEAENSQPGGHRQFGGAAVPPKHLAHLDVDATEMERDVVPRP
ncbi:RNA helicase [Vermiconidia calcicola]|uniref:RNA helicase n=1 Tax=Vermiconidia calcicola TaxID=1690605 RepID=A0ACC3NQY4_9PEZI|nr:RNA helicase [Vermiconidia calcicola]